jgi:hypothetical protein
MMPTVRTNQTLQEAPPIASVELREINPHKQRLMEVIDKSINIKEKDRYKKHVMNLDANNAKDIAQDLDNSYSQHNARDHETYTLRTFEGVDDAQRVAGPGKTREFNAALAHMRKRIEHDAKENARLAGMPGDEMAEFLAKTEIMTASQQEWEKYKKEILEPAAHEGIRLLLVGGAFRDAISSTAYLLGERIKNVKKKEEDTAKAERDIRERDMNKTISASEMNVIMGQEDLVEKLGISHEAAEELVRELQNNPQFKDLIGKNKGLKVNDAIALAIARKTAENRGIQVHEQSNPLKQERDA